MTQPTPADDVRDEGDDLTALLDLLDHVVTALEALALVNDRAGTTAKTSTVGDQPRL